MTKYQIFYEKNNEVFSKIQSFISEFNKTNFSDDYFSRVYQENQFKKKAKEIIGSIENLEDFIFELVDAFSFILPFNAQVSYNKIIQLIENDYLPSQRPEQIQIYKNRLIEEWNGFRMFKVAYSEAKKDGAINSPMFKKIFASKCKDIILESEHNYYELRTIDNFLFLLSDFLIANSKVEYLMSLEEGMSIEIKTLKDLFDDPDDFDRIIKLLKDNKVITVKADGTFKWVGINNDSDLKPLTLLATLGCVLKDKYYLKSKVSGKELADVLSKTFPDFKLSSDNFGRVRRDMNTKVKGSKTMIYYNSFSFITGK